jgi:hypothetical protein
MEFEISSLTDGIWRSRRIRVFGTPSLFTPWKLKLNFFRSFLSTSGPCVLIVGKYIILNAVILANISVIWPFSPCKVVPSAFTYWVARSRSLRVHWWTQRWYKYFPFISSYNSVSDFTWRTRINYSREHLRTQISCCSRNLDASSVSNFVNVLST